MTDSNLKCSRSEMLRLWPECNLAEVRPTALAVVQYLRQQGLGEEDVQSCEVALVEACNNAIHYATEAGRTQPIEVDVLCGAKAVEIRVTDHTAGFVLPKQVDLPAADEESGRGLFLIHTLMDEVRYFQGDGSNCLVMRRTRTVSRTSMVATQEVDSVSEARQKLKESENIIRDMAEELSFCYESLSAIFRCSAELGRTNNLDEFAQRMLSDLAQITSAEWFVLRLVAKEESHLVVFAGSDPSLQLMPLPLGTAGSLHSAELEAALTQQDVWFDEGRPLERTDPLGAVKPHAVGLIHPFSFGENLIGTLTVGKTEGKPHLTAVHANVVHTFADFLAIQIVNSRFQEEQVASRIVSREIEIARNIQRSLLPKELPRVPGFSLAGFCESARQVGGDFYDVLRVGDDGLLLTIADVMGKGMPAAMFAAILRSLLRAVPEWTVEPSDLLGRVNRLLFEELSAVDMFITAQLIFVDTRRKRLVVASAGHCPALIATGPDGEVKAISPEGLPLGILPDTTFGSHTERLSRNCRILVYTDGLTEARNAAGEFFGQDRLVAWLRSTLSQDRTAFELKDHLAAELDRFRRDSSMTDDQTFLIMAN